ncbi:hypothetical protein EDB84DRAFT_1572789 [Lactarius hengduanensis]|nr:hypothetical protein EDB84DRAFT_1572789 [Lactarius hengduanensis]
MPRIYKDFKEAISIRFNTNQHPAPQFEKMAAAFAWLGAITVGTGANAITLAIRPQLQALVAMSALPQKWEHLIPVMCNNLPLADLKLETVSACVESQYKTESNRGQHKAAHNAQKLSAVKWKPADPHFLKQGSSQQQSSAPGPSTQQQPFRQRVNKALTLAERLDLHATVQTVKTLEQRFADIDAQMCPHINRFMDEEYDSNVDIDMSQQPSGSAQLIMNLDGLDDTEIFGEHSNALQLDLTDLTISDGGSDKENRAPTPPYVNPASIVEATVRWATTGKSRFPHIPLSRSNKQIERIWRSNQQYLYDNGLPTDPRFGTLISPAASGCSLTPESFLTGPDTEILDWGSNNEEDISPAPKKSKWGKFQL